LAYELFWHVKMTPHANSFFPHIRERAGCELRARTAGYGAAGHGARRRAGRRRDGEPRGPRAPAHPENGWSQLPLQLLRRGIVGGGVVRAFGRSVEAVRAVAAHRSPRSGDSPHQRHTRCFKRQRWQFSCVLVQPLCARPRRAPKRLAPRAHATTWRRDGPLTAQRSRTTATPDGVRTIIAEVARKQGVDHGDPSSVGGGGGSLMCVPRETAGARRVVGTSRACKR
jgi:hypothetical protein